MYPALHTQTLLICALSWWPELDKQSVHVAEPGDALYVENLHAEHVLPSAPVYPASQTQTLPVCALSWCPELFKQSVHAVEPLAALYVDAGHAEHGPPSGPEKPRKHWHAVLSV